MQGVVKLPIARSVQTRLHMQNRTNAKYLLTSNRNTSILTRPFSRPLLVTAAAAGVDNEVDSDDETTESEYEPFDYSTIRNSEGGYTPFDFIEFTDIPVKHEVSCVVNKPIDVCYQAWYSRLNWMQWFEMIDEMGFHEEEPSFVSMYLWYRYGRTPFLELYCTLSRTKEEENKYILEEPIEGLPLVAAVLFQPGESDAAGSTNITLRISYLLPKVLHEFVGRIAVYGDVDDLLAASMLRMKAFVEAVDTDQLQRVAAEDDVKIKEGFELQRRMKEEAEEAAAAAEAEAEQAASAASASVGVDVEQEDEDEQAAVPLSFGNLGLNGSNVSESDTESDGDDGGSGIGRSDSVMGIEGLQEGGKAPKVRRKRATGGAASNPAAGRKPRKTKVSTTDS